MNQKDESQCPEGRRLLRLESQSRPPERRRRGEWVTGVVRRCVAIRHPLGTRYSSLIGERLLSLPFPSRVRRKVGGT